MLFGRPEHWSSRRAFWVFVVYPGVREGAARALLHVVMNSMEQPRPVARLEASVAAMAESLGNSAPAVRWHAALALAHIDFIWP